MGEPLRGKLYSFHELEDWITETSEENYNKDTQLKVLLRVENVKSAVKWLKDMYKVHIKNIDKSTREQLFDYIEEAFPDLYPKKQT